MADNKRYRVAQWATGNVGSRAMRRTIEHPDLELVGCWVHGDKAGRDAGELAGVGPVGVKATNSIEDIIAARPDCVLYMPHENVYDDVCRLLEAGINIVGTRAEYQYPGTMDPAIRTRVEEACRRGNSSIHSTGSSPGFISEAMPIVLASIQRRWDCYTIHEFADCSSRDSPEMLFGFMGFGADPSVGPNKVILEHHRATFGGTLTQTPEALGIKVDSIDVSSGIGVARTDVHIAAGLVPKGTIAATRTVMSAMHGGKPVMKMVANWFVSSDVDTSDGEEWEFRSVSGWRLLLEGDCPLDVSITFPVAPEDYADMTPGLTAHRPVNMVSYVCEAPPGIRTTADLPQCIAKLG